MSIASSGILFNKSLVDSPLEGLLFSYRSLPANTLSVPNSHLGNTWILDPGELLLRFDPKFHRHYQELGTYRDISYTWRKSFLFYNYMEMSRRWLTFLWILDLGVKSQNYKMRTRNWRFNPRSEIHPWKENNTRFLLKGLGAYVLWILRA